MVEQQFAVSLFDIDLYCFFDFLSDFFEMLVPIHFLYSEIALSFRSDSAMVLFCLWRLFLRFPFA